MAECNLSAGARIADGRALRRVVSLEQLESIHAPLSDTHQNRYST
jgi:hypothetical protein